MSGDRCSSESRSWSSRILSKIPPGFSPQASSAPRCSSYFAIDATGILSAPTSAMEGSAWTWSRRSNNFDLPCPMRQHRLIVGDAMAAEMEQYPRRRWGWRKKKTGPALTHCENCGAALTGRYCAKCGQAAIDYHRSFGTLLADAADAFLNLDERFLKTFGLVLFKPWRLTNEFLAGRRQRYVHPLRFICSRALRSSLSSAVSNIFTRTKINTRSLSTADPTHPKRSPPAPSEFTSAQSLGNSVAPEKTKTNGLHFHFQR